MIGFDLPIPQISSWGEDINSIIPYTSLSNSDSQFLYASSNPLNEVSVAVIRPEEKKKINAYFERLINFYKGIKKYDNRILVANAMIPSDGTLSQADFANSKYPISNIDYLSDITDYEDYAQAKKWKQEFSDYLGKYHYEFLILNAHGAREYHYPCNDTGCIDSNFIKNTNLDAKYIIAISCNIGNFMTKDSPMASYVFDGNSLVGLGAEMPYTDVDSRTAKDIFSKMTKNSQNIADAGRPYGFVVLGDPFL